MIRLTRAKGQALYVNPEHLIEVGYDEDYKQTLVSTLTEGWYIQESPEEVARKVLLCYRYKEVHRTACRELESEEERETFHKLLELAGLEGEG